MYREKHTHQVSRELRASHFEYIERSDELLFDWTLAKTVRRTQREIIKFYIIAQILNECELHNLDDS